MTTLIIRKEQPADYDLIFCLTQTAFEPKAFSDGTEANVIDRLRTSGDLTISLVAESDTDLIGHVAFSPVQIGQFSTGWYGLGPVSVHPDHQLKGVGSALIEKGLTQLRERDADGCALIGDPNYYSRFGFVSNGEVQYNDVHHKNVQWISFGKLRPAGKLVFSSAFDG